MDNSLFERNEFGDNLDASSGSAADTAGVLRGDLFQPQKSGNVIPEETVSRCNFQSWTDGNQQFNNFYSPLPPIVLSTTVAGSGYWGVDGQYHDYPGYHYSYPGGYYLPGGYWVPTFPGS